MLARLFSAAALAGAMLLAAASHAAPADPQPQSRAGQDQEQQASDRHHDPERMRAFLKARLEKLAATLELKDSQRDAWSAFASSVEALAERPASPPGDNADAATIARFRADLAAGFARKLATIADTTGRLQAVLNENQRKTFNDAYRRFRRHGHGCGPHGPHGRDDGRDDSGDGRPD